MLLFSLLLACQGPPDEEPIALPELGELFTVVPGPGLPPEVVTQDSNNNLDVLEHGGEVLLAFRTAPSHFASDQARLYVMRSADQEVWTHEAGFSFDTDLREPRLLQWDGQVFLYFAVLGDDPNDFEPQGTMVSVREPSGSWTDPQWLFEDGFIPWRVRVVNGEPVMIGYTGGAEIYDGESLPELEVQMLRSDDGLSWEPWVEGQPTVYTGGGSEADFVLEDDGRLVAVIRNEAGDADGWGSRVCRAPADRLGEWECVADPRKYDSPLMFRSQGRSWLIGRRNVTGDGAYDLGMRDLSHEQQTTQYELAYWQAPKRCSLWEVDGDALQVDWVLDLPSRGDTCFPSALDLGAGRWMVYNYSNDPEGPDLDWVEGQHGQTQIYRQELMIP